MTYYVQRTAIGPWIIKTNERENTDLTEIKACTIQEDNNWTEGYVKVIKLSVFKTVNNFFHITITLFLKYKITIF